MRVGCDDSSGILQKRVSCRKYADTVHVRDDVFFPTKEVFLFGLSGNNVYICPLLYLSDKANRKEDDVSFG